ncbi:MAG: glycosyltransferase family 4 protein [Actinomycetota bacterium]|nr:glycosyltransferase family 4 protein [Actinomycetota bacterium]
MRITVVTKEFPPQLSGIGDYADRLATELSSRGHHLSVVCASPAEPRATFDVHATLDMRDIAGVSRAIASTKPDVIVWQYNPFSAGSRGLPLRARAFARALSRVAPLVVVFHELWFPWRRAGIKGLAWAITQRAAARGVMMHAARWIVTTELREAELADRRVRRIPIGTNVIPIGARTESGSFVVAHFGNAGSGRDLDPVCRAIEALRSEGIDARLLLLGDAGPVHVPATLVDAVEATGAIGLDVVAARLASASVFVHCDPVGPAVGRRGTLVAALAHGLPLVAYRGPQTAPQLQDGYNVALVDRDARAMTDVLRALATDPVRRRALGMAAKETFDAEFSWERIGDRILAVLEEVAR